MFKRETISQAIFCGIIGLGLALIFFEAIK